MLWALILINLLAPISSAAESSEKSERQSGCMLMVCVNNSLVSMYRNECVHRKNYQRAEFICKGIFNGLHEKML